MDLNRLDLNRIAEHVFKQIVCCNIRADAGQPVSSLGSNPQWLDTAQLSKLEAATLRYHLCEYHIIVAVAIVDGRHHLTVIVSARESYCEGLLTKVVWIIVRERRQVNCGEARRHGNDEGHRVERITHQINNLGEVWTEDE